MPFPERNISFQGSRGGIINGGKNMTPSINIYGKIHITNTLGDGRVITEIIEPFLLKIIVELQVSKEQ
jgi:hypothetical protein